MDVLQRVNHNGLVIPSLQSEQISKCISPLSLSLSQLSFSISMDGTYTFRRHGARFGYNQSSEAHSAKETKSHYADPEEARLANLNSNET